MQAPVARPHATRAAPVEPRTLGRAAFAGRVDLTAAEPGVALAREASDHETVLAAPGLELRLNDRRVAWHATATAVTLVTGRPLIDGRDANAAQVDQVLGQPLDPGTRLGGRFAIVRIDLSARDVLLATDRFGVFPLAWSRTGARVTFSDRADQVSSNATPDIDPQALFDYVYFHVIPATRTVFRGVYRLEAATAVRLSRDDVREQRMWQHAWTRRREVPRPSHADFQATVQSAVLDEAGDARTGCFLSGGTDSSTVAGMLARAGSGLKTFSIGFDAAGYDEMAYARLAARHFGTDHHEYYVTPDDLVRAIPVVAAQYDQPFGNSSAVPAYYCARLAADSGIERMLAGDGGDELFGGNVRYAKQKVLEAYGHVPAVLRSAVVEPLLGRPAVKALPGLRKAASYVTQARVPMPGRMETYNLLRRFGVDAVFPPSFLDAVDASAPEALQADVYRRSEGAAFVDRMLAYDWRFTLTDNDLPKVVGTTELAGLEVGFPLLADPVVDLSLQLDATDKVRRLRLRHYFKEALAGFLPPQIIAKKKHGFGLPVGPWLVASASFRAMAYDALHALADRGLIQRGLVADLFSRRLEEHPGYYGEMVWVLMMLEYWMRAHAPSWSWR